MYKEWSPRALMIASLLLAPAFGCSERQRDPNGGASSAAVTAEAALSGAPANGAAASISPTSSPTAAPSTTTSAASEAASLAGTWEGAYHAKKGSVEMPGHVKDAARSADDGKAASGAGTVTITISADGEISGKAKGALGDATLRGKVEGGMIRASVFPDNPGAPTAMTGVLVGIVKESAIEAELRVSGPDATVVRESPVELKRK